MSNRYLMGIDNGGTSTKAAIYDMEGHEIKKTTTNTKMLTPRPFFTERDMEELHKANIYVIKKTINDSMVNPHNIVGIAVTGHGNGMYMSDEHGKATHNGIISTDTRAERYVQKWLKDPAYDTVVRPKTMQNVWASQPPALMAWLQDHEPEVLERTKYVFMVPDMVRFWLTGVARTEITNMSGTSLMNLKTKEFDPELFKFFGIEKWLDKLPPIAKSTEQCGAITQAAADETGLVAGTPVSGGVFDIAASALSTGLVHRDKLGIVTGTWSINEYITDHPTVVKDLFMTSIYPIKDRWLITEASPTSASNLEWFINTFMSANKRNAQAAGFSIYDLCNKLVSQTDPRDSDLLFFPFIFGGNAVPNATSGFVGATKFHELGYFVRAVYEGVVFSHMYHIEKLRHINDKLTGAARIAGGITNSKVWLQIFADTLQQPLELVNVKENGTLGTAMTAGVMTGDFASVEEAAKKMVHVGKTIEPNPEDVPVYQKKYQHYKEVLKLMNPVWQKMETF
ncbi:FGGY-family carbohydrate kinase [Lacticaseibacillus parahuelsenbergensis]|uniref:FGGY-family carbohydrate kinase n=1 Tax=Lacticaseibacillus parahuelsenbergensis TaxID=3068305 RepID=A0ABY9L3Z1_9LACO|nr:FGGY-family carbohydrate kinase [Lacticaseibacillus sp. NCIMB 15471]WLV78413.1 FGGY-family carbohydrate kinase [Lacticaseibacillus sp. NCIMB 15471]